MKELKSREPLQPGTLVGAALVPDAILKHPTLSAGARLLWVMLAEYHGKSAESFPLEETLAVALGVKVRRLQSYIKELVNYRRGDPPEPLPLLEVKRASVGKERKTRNIYKLLRLPFLAVDIETNGAEAARQADGGDAQYSARWSMGDSQDAVAAPPTSAGENVGAGPDCTPSSDARFSAHQSGGGQRSIASRTDTPSEDGPQGSTGMPRGNTQFSAHRSQGGTQDSAVALLEIPSGEGNAQSAAHPSEDEAQDPAVLDSPPPSDAQSLAHRSEGAARSAISAQEGNAQYSAHRRGGETQDITAASSAIPSEDSRARSDDMAPSDTQSFAHRSGGDGPDSATAPLAIPGQDGAMIRDGMPRGDEQFSARPSEGNTQYPAATWPVCPDVDGAAVTDGMRPSDTQSTACRSGGDTQESATAPPTMPVKDSGLTPDAIATLRDVYANAQLRRQQQMRR